MTSNRSLLYRSPPEETEHERDIPDFFVDLNLDQIMEGIAKPWQDSPVRSWFLSPLSDEGDIRYRQDAFRDLETPETEGKLREFSLGIRSISRQLESQGNLYDIQKEGWFLATARSYCNLLRDAWSGLLGAKPQSEALKGLASYIGEYIASPEFKGLEEGITRVEGALSRVKYNLIVKSDRVTVQAAGEQEGDFSQSVREVFSRFRETEGKPREFQIRQFLGEGYVHAQILAMIEKLYLDEIGILRKFADEHRDFIEPIILKFSREAPFYLSYLDYTLKARERGLPFCIPQLSESSGISASQCFDLALAVKLSKDKAAVVANDFSLEEDERIIVVTGPNNGGKTTFARSVGQIFYLASLGCPVPGNAAALAVPDGIFTHFERSESLENLRGKLEDDLHRIKNIIDSSTSRSVVIINEMLSSTTVSDATGIGKRIIELIGEKGCLCIFVTFLDEFSTYSSTVSMVAQIDPENPEIRTFKVIREPSNGLAYARALARKHHVSGEEIRGRVANA